MLVYYASPGVTQFRVVNTCFCVVSFSAGCAVENSDQWKSIRRENFFLNITHTTKVDRFASFSSSNWQSCATDLSSSSSSRTFWCHGPRYMALCEKTLHTSPLMTKHVFEPSLNNTNYEENMIWQCKKHWWMGCFQSHAIFLPLRSESLERKSEASKQLMKSNLRRSQRWIIKFLSLFRKI